MANVGAQLIEDARALLGVDLVSEMRGGAQKAVHLVRLDGEELVLKVIALTGSNTDGLKRAEREVELLASLHSPHVVRLAHPLVELGDPPQGAAWLEEYLDGEDLGPLLTSGAWDSDQTIDMAHQVSLGLGAAHAQRVVHRDLSPNNVRRLSGGTYKVLDFGFARHTLRSGLTFAGQPGTPGYMSPEHLQSYSGAPTAASDVFSVGILMYQALTGHVPIPYLGDDADYIRRLGDVVVEEVSTVRPGLPDGVVLIINRCLHPQPARRFRSGSQLALALEAVR